MQKFNISVFLTLLCLILYLPGIAVVPFLDRDEPHFAQASRQMVETKDYWHIFFQDKPRHLKPPGIYWLQSLVVNLSNHKAISQTWPYRLPSVIGALFAVWLTFAFGCFLFEKKVAFLAAILLACNLLLIIEAHLAVTDAMLLATMVAMQWALAQIYITYRHNESVKWYWPTYFWIAMAAGILIKGITPLVGGLTIFALCCVDREIRWLKALRPLWGIPLLLILCVAWLIPMSKFSGHNFLWDMIKGDVIPKLAGGQQKHGMPPGYFTALFTASFWPGSLFIIPALIVAWQKRQQFIVRFLLAWIIPNWLFFELIPTKLPEYLLPVYPAIALLTAIAIHTKHLPFTGKIARILLILQPLAWLFFTLFLIWVCGYIGGWAWLSGGIIFLAAIYLLYIFYHSKCYPYAVWGIIAAACALIPIWQMVLPHLSSLWISNKVVQKIQHQQEHFLIPDPTHPLYAIGYQEPSLVFLLGTHAVVFTSLPQAIQQIHFQGQGLLLVSTQQLFNLLHLHQTYGFKCHLLATVEGFQYNRGKWVKLQLILMEAK